MKKILSVLLILSMCVSMTCAGVFQSSASVDDVQPLEETNGVKFYNPYGVTLGDINDDDKVNAADLTPYKLRLAGKTVEFNATNADINRDGHVSSLDVLTLKLDLAGKVAIKGKYAPADSDNRVDGITIAGNNISEYTVVVPAGATRDDNIHYAAEELINYIDEACGIELPMAYGSADGRTITLSVDTTATLGTEGFDINVTDGNLTIVGGRLRGSMYAVYQILEDCIGFRFISSDGPYLYEENLVDIPEGFSEHYVPGFSSRGVRHTFSGNDPLKYGLPRKVNDIDDGGKNGSTWRYGRGIGRQFANAHSFYLYKGGADGQQNAEVMKQPCFTSEEDYQTLFAGLLYWTRQSASWSAENVLNPEVHQVSFSINDTNDDSNFCSCRPCRIATREEGTKNGPYLAMVNRAANEFQEYYPGVKLFCIIYEHTVPKTVRPNENVVLCYCGTGCNNHAVGSGLCGDGRTPLGTSNKEDEAVMAKWAEITSTIYFWYYPVSYHYYLAPCPNVLTIFDEVHYIYSIGFDSFFYEGGGVTYNFEELKAYLSSRLEWNPTMTREEFNHILQEYLYLKYGEGWEYIYKFIVMQDEAGNAAGCFINNHDRPFNMYSEAYLREHWEYMSDLLKKAYTMTSDSNKQRKCRELRLSIDFLGLSATYDSKYVGGSEAERAEYLADYTEFYTYLKDNLDNLTRWYPDEIAQDENCELNSLRIFSSNIYKLPGTLNLDTSPMVQFYEDGYC